MRRFDFDPAARSRTRGLTVSVFLGSALLALLLPVGGATAASEVTTYTPSRIQWKALNYRASRMGVRALSEIRIEVVRATTVNLIEPEGGGLQPDDEELVKIDIDSTVRGRDSTMTLLIDPQTAAAYQRTMFAERRRETLFRTFRFLDQGVFIRRQVGPAGASDPSTFPTLFERVIDYPPGLSSSAVSEASALFYILSAGDFESVGDELTFYNFDRDGMSKVTLRVEELTEFDVDYTEISSSGERRVRDTRPVARLTVSGSAVGEGEDAFSFLGLQGNIEIFADLELRVPAAVRGRVPRAGNTTVRIDSLTLP